MLCPEAISFHSLPAITCDGKSCGRKSRWVLLASNLTEIPIQPEQSTRLRLDRQAPIDPHQNPSDRLLDRLLHFSVHPTPKFFRQPLEMEFEGSRGELDHGERLPPIQPGQVGLEGSPALLGRREGRLQRGEVSPPHDPLTSADQGWIGRFAPLWDRSPGTQIGRTAPPASDA